MSQTLNNEQQELIEVNHNLIYEFAKKKHLFIDDYYDILAIGLCKAAMVFNPEKGEFSTIAFRCMENELNMQIRYENRMFRIPSDMLLSYDAPKDNDNAENNGSFLDGFADSCSVHDTVIGEMMSALLMNLLSEKQQQIVRWLMDGKKQDEIAEALLCSQQSVSYYIKQIRKTWIAYLANC